jgi:hypothetical protein
MSNEQHPREGLELPISLEEVQQRFDTWRQHRKKRTNIPHHLWEAAVRLSKQYSVSHLSKILRINHSALKRQIQLRSPADSSASDDACPAFFNLPLPSLHTAPECTVEIFRSDGSHMRMHLKAATGSELLELGKAFLANGS